jgi:hypothetical protein
MTPTTEDRLRAAFDAKAAAVTPAALDPGRPSPDADVDQRDSSRWSARWVAPLLAAAAVIGVAVATAAIVNTPTAHHITPAGPTNSVVPTPSASVSPTATADPRPATLPTVTSHPRTSPSVAQASSSGPGGTCYFAEFVCRVPAGYLFYEPLWPFASYAQARQWETVDGPAGHQPWHADPASTALSFVNGYLGFSDIDLVTSTNADGNEAHIGVGYALPNGQKHTAAVLHLVRFSATVGNTNAGWEVVGSDDTDFSLEQPAYGSQVSSPMTVGGHITGVDENIVVDVKAASGSVLVGTPVGVPAGGQNSPWHATVSFHGSGVLTVIAVTGGHLRQHERFAVQGVHT